MNNAIAQQIEEQGGVEAYLHSQQHKSLLRFLTCGSVDDGKSTLIGRLLHDTRQIYEDQLTTCTPTANASALKAKNWIWPCWWTVCRPNASRALPLMSPTAIFPPKNANLSSPTPQGTSNIPAIWPPVLPPVIWPFYLSTHVRGYWIKPVATALSA